MGSGCSRNWGIELTAAGKDAYQITEESFISKSIHRDCGTQSIGYLLYRNEDLSSDPPNPY